MVFSAGQVRKLVADYFALIAVAIVVVGLLGGVITYQVHVSPGEEIETVEESSWATTTAFDHQATIIEETDVFAEGETLVNQPTYFAQLAPVLDGTFQFSYTATESGEVDAETTLTLTIQASDDEVEYWTDEEQLERTTDEGIEPGDDVTVPFSVNVTEMQDRVDQIEDQLGATPGEIETAVQAEIEYTGEKNDIPYEEETLTHELSIDTDGNLYSIDGAEPTENEEPQFSEQTVPVTHHPLLSFGGPLLILLAGGALITLTFGREKNWFTFTAEEETWYAHKTARDEFNDWITPGRIPQETQTETVIEVDSLEGIVDVAIDSTRRVIEVKDTQTYVVLVDGTKYRYTAPKPPASVEDDGATSNGQTESENLLGTADIDPLSGSDGEPSVTHTDDTNGESQLTNIGEIGEIYAERLAENDIETLTELSSAEIEQVASIADIDENRAEEWITQASEELEAATTQKQD